MYDVENSIGFLLAKGYQRAWALLREELEPFELTPPQFALLAFLWKQDGLSQSELSDKGQIDRTTVGGLIDRLERLGLVERQHHPQDRRAYKIHLTRRGMELEKTLGECAERSLKRFTSGLSPEQVEQFRHVLKTVRGERKVYELPPY